MIQRIVITIGVLILWASVGFIGFECIKFTLHQLHANAWISTHPRVMFWCILIGACVMIGAAISAILQAAWDIAKLKI